MAYNRDLSQFASLVEVHNTSKRIGFSTDLNISGILTATRFYGDGRYLTDIVIASLPDTTGTNKEILFNDSLQIKGASNLFYDKTSGSVGIGTSAPTAKLNVDGNAIFTGIVTATTFNGQVNVGVGTITALNGTNLNYSGITTVGSLNIGATQVISSGRQLQNIASLDATTTATIESAIAAAPNNFNDLNVTGVSTFTNGPVLVGSSSSTGTISQPLQIIGGTYVSGNLGVGVTNPASNTQVAIAGTLGISEVSGSGVRTLLSSSGSGFILNHNDNSNINIQSQGSNRLAYQVSNNAWTINSTGTSLLVGTGVTTGTASQPLQITGGAYISGNTGIGTTNATSKLHVVGDVLVSGAVTSNTGYNLGISSSGISVATDVVKTLNFVGTGNSFTYNSSTKTIDISIQSGSGSNLNVLNNTSTNSTFYVGFTTNTTGITTSLYVSSGKLQFNPFSGDLAATQFTSLSDATQKTNVRPIDNAIDITKKLQGVRFDWINNNKPSIGVIAQEVEKILPEIVETNSDGIKSVCYGNIIGVLIEAIKEQQVRIEELERKLDA